MADLLGRGSDWLQSQRHSHLTREIVYRRVRGGAKRTMRATVGRREFEQTDSAGAVIQNIQTRDYLVRSLDMGGWDEPAEGDRITDGDLTFQVLSPGGAPPWEYSDENQLTMRIHCKAVAP